MSISKSKYLTGLPRSCKMTRNQESAPEKRRLACPGEGRERGNSRYLLQVWKQTFNTGRQKAFQFATVIHSLSPISHHWGVVYNFPPLYLRTPLQLSQCVRQLKYREQSCSSDKVPTEVPIVPSLSVHQSACSRSDYIQISILNKPLIKNNTLRSCARNSHTLFFLLSAQPSQAWSVPRCRQPWKVCSALA